jgi:spore coat polysaccharide biosynthesis predicted glycosyltransferase SpsG
LWIDDTGHCDQYYADIILNQNIHATPKLYPNTESYTQLLLGTKYALLRKEFLQSQTSTPSIPDKAKNILITLGGSDPDNVTLKTIEALKLLKDTDWEAKVIVGGSYHHHKSLENIAKDKIELIHDSDRMPELMQWADCSISGGGSTCWELAYMGVPGILLVIADNQLESARMLAEQGAFLTIENATQVKPDTIARTLSELIANRELRMQLSHNANQLIDGNGISRIIACVAERIKMEV